MRIDLSMAPMEEEVVDRGRPAGGLAGSGEPTPIWRVRGHPNSWTTGDPRGTALSHSGSAGLQRGAEDVDLSNGHGR